MWTIWVNSRCSQYSVWFYHASYGIQPARTNAARTVKSCTTGFGVADSQCTLKQALTSAFGMWSLFSAFRTMILWFVLLSSCRGTHTHGHVKFWESLQNQFSDPTSLVQCIGAWCLADKKMQFPPRLATMMTVFCWFPQVDRIWGWC